MAIGAYNSSSVVLLRARPIIDVTTSLYIDNLERIDPGKAGCSVDRDTDDACFDFRACFRVESANRNLDMKIQFMIVAEPKKLVASRVWLKVDGVEDKRKSKNISHILDIQVRYLVIALQCLE